MSPCLFASLPSRSTSPDAVRYPSAKPCVSRLQSASRRGTVKSVETPGWRPGKNATPGYSTSVMTTAALQTASSKKALIAGKLHESQVKFICLSNLRKQILRQWINVCSHSDRNSPCCKNCQFMQAGTRCQEPISATCKGKSSCTGNLLHTISNSLCVTKEFTLCLQKSKIMKYIFLFLNSQATAVSALLLKTLLITRFVWTTAAAVKESVTPSVRPCRT